MNTTEIQRLEKEIFELTTKLKELQVAAQPVEVSDYQFETEFGSTQLSDLFGVHDTLLTIHNMGQGCRYCTLWADGINGLLPHLESTMSVVLLSKDAPDVQRKFANSRGWRFKLASHRSSAYAADHIVVGEYENMPGAAIYLRENSKILKKNTCIFGPGDMYCSLWYFLALSGINENDWTPQFRYWQIPEKLEDGGKNLED